MKVFTRHAHEVALQLSLTYDIPPASVDHLLYEVGPSGNVGIVHNLKSVDKDHVRSVVSRPDVTDLASEAPVPILPPLQRDQTTK